MFCSCGWFYGQEAISRRNGTMLTQGGRKSPLLPFRWLIGDKPLTGGGGEWPIMLANWLC